MRRGRRGAAAGRALAAWALCLSACSGEVEAPVVVVAARGAEVDRLRAAAGELDPSSRRALSPLLASARSLDSLAAAETAPAVATLETGAWPDRHGLVGGRFFADEGAAPVRSALEQPLGAEPLWRLAARARRRVLRVGSPFGDEESTPGVASVPQPESSGEVTVRSLHDAPPLGTWRSRKLGLDAAGRPLGSWQLGLSGGRALERARVASRATPVAFARETHRLFGPEPGGFDWEAFRAGAIDEAALWEQIRFEHEWNHCLVRHHLARGGFDLVLLDDPLFDRVGHAYLVEGVRTGGWSALAAVAARRRAEADRVFLRSLQRLVERLDDGASLLLVSSYRLSPVRARVSLARLLRDGAARADSAPPRLAVGSTTAHLRFDGGSADLELTAAWLRAARDPDGGAPLLGRVVRRDGLARLRMGGVGTGDLWLQAAAGYTLAAGEPSDELLGLPRFPGDHGFLDGGRGAWVAYRGPRALAAPAEGALVDVAATALDLLGLGRRHNDGASLLAPLP